MQRGVLGSFTRNLEIGEIVYPLCLRGRVLQQTQLDLLAPFCVRSALVCVRAPFKHLHPFLTALRKSELFPCQVRDAIVSIQ